MDEAIRVLCARNLHQCIWLPQSTSHERLRVSYSTTSNFTDDSLPVVLFCLPMFGSRYHTLDIDHLANEHGVRVICIDRPGMGGSSPVDLALRVQVWLEAVTNVLRALETRHVSLASHSAGTIYAFNTLYHLRDIVDPQAPYVALVAPWVHSEHSQATLMRIVSNLPASWMGNWDQCIRFINNRIMPVTSWSGGVFSSVSNIFRTDPGSAESGETSPAEKYGVSEEVAEHIEKLRGKYFFAENTKAANEEALLCSKKGGAGLWGICEDYEKYVRSLTELEQRRRVATGVQSSESKLQVRMFFAEDDIMIGKGGQAYFEQCWKQEGVANVIDVADDVLPGTDHDTALGDLKKGSWRAIFEDVKKRHT